MDLLRKSIGVLQRKIQYEVHFQFHFYDIRLYQTNLLSKHSFVLCSQEPNSDRLPRPLQAHCYNRITIFKAQKAITSCDLLGARVLQYRSHTGTTSSYVKHISNTIYYQVTQNLPTLILGNYLQITIILLKIYTLQRSSCVN